MEQVGILTYPEGDPDAVTLTKEDIAQLQPGMFLRDNVVDFYIK